jgi:hypothetical protein
MDLTLATKVIIGIVIIIMTVFAYWAFMLGAHKND